MKAQDYKISGEKFVFHKTDGDLHDKKLETKPVSYLQDALHRFSRNKASIVASVIIAILVLFAIFGPMLTPYTVTYEDDNYAYALPKIQYFYDNGIHFWDGGKDMSQSKQFYDAYRAIEIETGLPVFDGTQDENQRNVLLKIMEVCDSRLHVEAFSKSPPYYMTESGCSSGAENASQDNLRADQVDAFARYLAEVVLYYKEHYGITFQSISPMNEPNTTYWQAYSPKQEGCHVTSGASQSAILVATQKALAEMGLTDVILAGTDETSTVHALNSFKKLTDEAKAALSRIDTHTYKVGNMQQLQQLAVDYGKNLWMSEVDGDYVLGEDAGEMGAGLWLANKMISDIQSLMPSAWILWQGIDNHVSSEGYMGRQDSGMPNLSSGYWGLTVVDHDNEEIILTKKFYAFGQLSRYIRPGYRILATDAYGMLMAYSDEEQKLVIVALNTNKEEKEMGFCLDAFQYAGGTAEAIRTSQSENWAILPTLTVQKDMLRATLTPNSITTFIISNIKL